MTPQERELLTQFLTELLNTPVGLKDAEAGAMIDNALRSRPDAAYVLVQHAVLADQALHRAQAEITALRNQVQSVQVQPQASFLGGGPTPNPTPTADPWGPRPQAPQAPYAPQAAYAQQPTYLPQAPMGGLFGGGFGGGLGGFLRTAGTMAAGVAAGDVLASGLEGLFGGHHGFGGGGGETIVNNYYDDSNDDVGGGGDWSGGDDGN